MYPNDSFVNAVTCHALPTRLNDNKLNVTTIGYWQLLAFSIYLSSRCCVLPVELKLRIWLLIRLDE